MCYSDVSVAPLSPLADAGHSRDRPLGTHSFRQKRALDHYLRLRSSSPRAISMSRLLSQPSPQPVDPASAVMTSLNLGADGDAQGVDGQHSEVGQLVLTERDALQVV